jgi:leader peptidase (prepilin peptidase)/N-methyltransferase
MPFRLPDPNCRAHERHHRLLSGFDGHDQEVDVEVLVSFFSLDWLFLIFVAPFIGSFLGVVATRVPAGEPAILGRSVCPHCGHRLAPRDLIPILSWVLQRRRCRYCGATLEFFYPVMEISALLVAVTASWMFSGWLLWVSCGLGWALLTIAAIDHLWMILPDELTLPLIPAGLVVTYLFDPDRVVSHATGAGIGFLAFSVVAWLYRRLRGHDGLGMGDAKLLAASGAWISISGLPSVVFLGAAAALIVVLIAMLWGRRFSSYDAVPFGLYLCLGTWLVWLFGPLG